MAYYAERVRGTVELLRKLNFIGAIWGKYLNSYKQNVKELCAMLNVENLVVRKKKSEHASWPAFLASTFSL